MRGVTTSCLDPDPCPTGVVATCCWRGKGISQILLVQRRVSNSRVEYVHAIVEGEGEIVPGLPESIHSCLITNGRLEGGQGLTSEWAVCNEIESDWVKHGQGSGRFYLSEFTFEDLPLDI